jgi:hypothetical protein
MRYRIAALVVLGAIACGDATSPEDDLALGTATLTVSGSIARVDTMMAVQAYLGGNHLVFTPLNTTDSFRIHGRVEQAIPLPYLFAIDFLNAVQLSQGTYAAAATSVVLLDSLGLASLTPTVGDSASGFPITFPVSDELTADTGHVAFDLVADDRVAGTIVYHLKSDAGRSASITGRFNATVRTFASPRRQGATSPPPPSPSRAQQ